MRRDLRVRRNPLAVSPDRASERYAGPAASRSSRTGPTCGRRRQRGKRSAQQGRPGFAQRLACAAGSAGSAGPRSQPGIGRAPASPSLRQGPSPDSDQDGHADPRGPGTGTEPVCRIDLPVTLPHAAHGLTAPPGRRDETDCGPRPRPPRPHTDSRIAARDHDGDCRWRRVTSGPAHVLAAYRCGIDQAGALSFSPRRLGPRPATDLKLTTRFQRH